MQIDDSIYLGDEWEYRLRRGDVTAQVHRMRKLPSGRVWARIPQDCVRVFPAGAR